MVDETDEPRDVLAAEEFAMPAPDPALRRAEARDVLAAEEFAMPAPDLRLRISSQPLTLPPDPYDPTGSEPAHDVLAAEEFAVPGTAAHDARAAAARRSRRQTAGGRVALAFAALALALGQLRRRRG